MCCLPAMVGVAWLWRWKRRWHRPTRHAAGREAGKEGSGVKTLWACLVAAWLAMLPSAAMAQSAQEMHSKCKPIVAGIVKDGTISFIHTYDTGVCWGAFWSIQQLSQFKESSDLNPMLGICAPEKATLTQHIRIFSRYVEQHPEKGHEDYVAIAWQALIAVFPCKD